MKQVTLRYDTNKIHPIVDELLPHMQEDYEPHKVSRAKVLLEALIEGLHVLRKRYGVES